ncbi:hypothetical protein K1719_040416 [Acacia pycnantha]|nr:hypothetical protein K1719_040416 [Acacia pycnantha]
MLESGFWLMIWRSFPCTTSYGSECFWFFTPEFLESDTFLQRLVNIRRCQKLMNKQVVAVFFGLSEEQVREQLQGMDQRRSDALSLDFDFDFESGGFVAEAASLLDLATAVTEAASLSDLGNKFRSRMANLGLCMMNDELFHDLPHHQVGLPLRVTELLKMLRIGGYFEGKSFLSNDRKVCGDENAGVSLMKQLIFDISETELNETNFVVMHEQMKQVLYQRRVLVVLDDVNMEFQLQELCKNVKKWCGLPLALEVFSSLLHKKTEEEWERIVKNMEGIPHGVMQKKLKICVDLLTDIEKDLFFNIAYLYVGQSKHYVTQLLKSSSLHAEMGMLSLIDHNLVKVMNDKLYVHDILQEIGRKISPSKPKLKYSYDVFLSFRGDDTRKSFTSHLCSALKQAAIEVYMDEEGIQRGEIISSSLLEAIESSRISIIIFSKNYADSSWCLQELEKIMECYKATSQEVLPIFFDVQPFEVRKQQNSFERLIKRTSISKRKKLTINLKRALVEAANLSGWDMHNYR